MAKQRCSYEIVGYSEDGHSVTLQRSRTKRGLKRSARQVLRQHPEVEAVAINYRCPLARISSMQFACTREGQQMRCHPVGTKRTKRAIRRMDQDEREFYNMR